MVVRDRDWQSFLKTPECRRHTVADVTALCRWWFLAGMLADMRRESRRKFFVFASAENVSAEEVESVSVRTDVRRL